MKQKVSEQERSQILKCVNDAMDQGATLIVFTDSGKDGIFFVMGHAVELVKLMVRGMRKHDKIKFLFEQSVEFFKSFLRKDRYGPDQTPDLNDIVGHDPLDCEKCELKGNCEIEKARDALTDLFTPDDLAKMMEEMLIKKRSN